MNYKKILITIFLCAINFQIQAFKISDAINIACTFIGFANPTEIINDLEHQVIYSYQAERLITKMKTFPINTIQYKYFKTKNGCVITKHIIDGTVFTINNIHYVVRSSIHNSEKIYETKKTLFGSQQIIVDSIEAITIMNDVRFLTFTKLQIISDIPTKIGKYNGHVTAGSYFTAHGINYIVQ